MKEIEKLVFVFIVGALALSNISCSIQTTLGGQRITETFSDKNTIALIKAAEAGNSDKVNRLITAGTKVDAIGNNGATPLIWVMYTRNYRGINILLEAGSDPNLITEKLANSPMYFASLSDDPELLRMLLDFGGDPNHPENGMIDERPLSQAASEGRIENMKMLLAAGADINAHDKYNESAATSALALGNFEATAFLLEQGFTYNLTYLAKRVNVIQVPTNSEAQRWKDKVIIMLKARGT